MSTSAQQTQTEAQQAQAKLQQIQSQKVVRGLQTGLQLLDADVNVPIKMHDGLTDLKWLLQNLLSGSFSIDLDPKGERGGRPQGTGAPKGRPLDSYPDGDDGKGNGKDKK